MSSNVVLARNFNTQKISFSQLRTLDSGGKQAYLNYDGGMFVLQTPRCRLPYGMSAFDKAGPVKYSAEISLAGYDQTGTPMDQFFKAIAGLDDFMEVSGVKQSRPWFKADLSRDVIKAFYTPVVRYAKDKDGNPKPYPPTVKLSLRKKRDSEEFDVQCFDDKKQPLKGYTLEELLVKGAEVSCLIQCTGVWFAGSKYGLSWKLCQVIVHKIPQSSRNFTFVDDEASMNAPAPALPEVAADEEEEEEEEEEDEVFSAPAAKPSVLTAVLPKVAPAPVASATMDEAADDAEPIPVPKKTGTTVVKKKVVTKAK
jgi:hypothetical protein